MAPRSVTRGVKSLMWIFEVCVRVGRTFLFWGKGGDRDRNRRGNFTCSFRFLPSLTSRRGGRGRLFCCRPFLCNRFRWGRLGCHASINPCLGRGVG